MPSVLTKELILAIQPETKRKSYADGKVSGLLLEVHPSGKKVFKHFYRKDGRAYKTTVGNFPDLSLAIARKKAQAEKHRIAAGENPALARRRQRQSETVRELVEPYLEHRNANKRRSIGEKRRILERYVIGRIGSIKLCSLSRRDIIELIDHVQRAHGGIMANRVLAEVRAMLNWALDRALVDLNVAARVVRPVEERSRLRTLDHEELSRIWRASTALGYPYGAFAQVLLLTGQRLSEVARMKRSEINPLHHLWTIPGSRTKNGLDHEVPLSGLVQSIVDESPLLGDHVFCSGRRGDAPINSFSGAKREIDKLLRAEKPMTHWTWHDLRRTFRTGLSQLGIAPHIAERAINHVDGGVRRIYDRHGYREEKREAFTCWSRHVIRVIECHCEESVIELNSAPAVAIIV